MSKLILGTERPCEEALATMRERGGRWYVYQSHDMSSRSLGDLQFLKCGPGCTLEAPPERMPDTSAGLGWRYLLVGEVDLETGAINEAPSASKASR
jgi:hypothetical protein